MKGKRIIALLLMHLYLLTVVVPAACALTCPCIDGGHHRHRDPHACLCYGQPDHQHLDEHDCCGHRHDTQIDLYTFDRNDDRESVRTVFSPVAALLPDEALRTVPESRWSRIPTPPEICQCEICDTPSVLRAPPALA